MPKVKINGQEFEFAEGLNLLDACRQAGYEIPHFCYHPAMSVAGSCRMCQVEIEMGGRRAINIACNTKVAEGMAVWTDTVPSKKAQQSALEFLLLNHPLDCPICDDAGECQLQNYYMLHDLKPSRMSEPKWHKHKVYDLGPNIVLDAERCILCSRCVRFFREIVKNPQLEIMNSGAKAELLPLPGKTLETEYTGNIVDLCPVGALTDRRFRFKRRVWYLETRDSVCPGCSRGCSIEIQYDIRHDWKNPGRRIQRLKPRLNFEINQYWLCDSGRYGVDFVDSADRLTHPLARNEAGHQSVVSWEDALSGMAKKLKEAGKKENIGKTAFIVAPQLSTGALFILKKFIERMGLKNVDYRIPSVKEGKQDELLQMKDRNPNSYAARLIGLVPGEGGRDFKEIIEGVKSGAIKYLLTVCYDPAEALGAEAVSILSKLKFYGVIHWNRIPSSTVAHYALPIATFAESNGTFINFEGRIQRYNEAFPAVGEARKAWQVFLLLGREMGYKFKAFSDAELFAEFANSFEKYRGLNWDKIGPLGKI